MVKSVPVFGVCLCLVCVCVITFLKPHLSHFSREKIALKVVHTELLKLSLQVLLLYAVFIFSWLLSSCCPSPSSLWEYRHCIIWNITRYICIKIDDSWRHFLRSYDETKQDFTRKLENWFQIIFKFQDCSNNKSPQQVK